MSQATGVWRRIVGLGSNDFESTWEGSVVGFELVPLSWCLEVLMEATKTPITIPDPGLRVQKMVIWRMYFSFPFRVGSHGKC